MQRKSISALAAAAASAAALIVPTTLNAGATGPAGTILYDPVVSLVGDGTAIVPGNNLGYTNTIQVFNNSVANQAAPVASQAYVGLTNTNSTAEAALANNPGVADAAAAGTSYGGTAYVYSGGYAGADGATFTTENRVVGDMSVTSAAITNPTLGPSYANTAAFTGSTFRGAVGDDTATTFWAAGTGSGTTGGFRYWNNNVQIAGQGTFNGGALALETNTRTIQVRNGQLYGSTDTGQFIGISAIGVGTPTPAANDTFTNTLLFQTGTNSGVNSPYSFLLLDDPNNPNTPTVNGIAVHANVAYITDNGNATGVGGDPNGGIQKWVYNPATATNNGWSLAYTIADPTHGNVVGNGYFGLAGQLITDPNPANDKVVLYTTTADNATSGFTVSGVTTNGTGGNALEQFTDQLEGSTAAVTDTTQITLATAPANYLFRGVALAPIVVSNLVWNNASGNNTWDNGASANWNGGSGNTVFNAGNNVTFGDSFVPGGSLYTVTLNTTVNPGSISVPSSLLNYTISGTGSIGGSGALTKNGNSTLTLATANTYSGGTNILNGILEIKRTSATTSALPKGALNITGGEVLLDNGVTAGSQTANPPVNGPNSNVTLTSLSISGNGTLDIGNNHIIVDYSGLAGDPILNSIAGWVQQGYNGGLWTGAGITSTAARLNALSYGIGYAASSDPGNPAGLASGQIEIMYTLLGDANLDGKVNGTDFAILATNFNQTVSSWDQGDFNYDFKANGSDFAFIGTNFNQGASQAALDAFAAANGLVATSVPEPTSIGLLAIAALSLTARKRRTF